MIADTCRLSSCAIAFRKTLDEDFRCTDITKADIICDDERTPRTKESNAARYDLLHLPIDHSELAEVVTAPAAVTKQVFSLGAEYYGRYYYSGRTSYAYDYIYSRVISL